jgi:hypothetical protein
MDRGLVFGVDDKMSNKIIFDTLRLLTLFCSHEKLAGKSADY